ncbi:protein spaetzle 4-like [Macrobrachium rosenbergii]|uniref:protein spaetzle 4-like n=1 Tax=Macrobrachium rosenbergii TaxID=79674 RepID=UPI0034D41C38
MTTPIYRLLPILGIWWELSAMALATPYDEYMTCGAGHERYGRQYHHHYYDVPCDLSKETFCLTPGTQYPWSAVRRFVHENQGLIKRMYGTQRHYNVLRSEFLEDMYEEMFNEMPKRQTHRFHPSSSTTSTARTGRYQKHSNANSLQDERTKKRNRNGNDPSSRSRSIKTISMEPEYLSKSGVASSLPQIASKLKAQQVSGNRLKDIQDLDQLTMDILESVADLPPRKRTTNSNTEIPHTTQAPTLPTDSTVFQATSETTTSKGNDWFTEEETAYEEVTTPNNGSPSHGKESEEEKERLKPTYLPLPNADELDFHDEGIWTTLGEELFDTFSTTTFSPELDEFSMSTLPEEISTQNPGKPDLSEIAFDHSEESDHPQNFGSTTSSDMDGLTTLKSLPDELPDDAAEALTEITDPVNDKKLTSAESPGKERATLNSKDPVDFFDDSDIEEREDSPLTKSPFDKEFPNRMQNEGAPPEPDRHKTPIRGFNACPVEEEFVAPYWANNTRGETLALLNLYPFEQYIQWERCKHEYRQMYCREGCRCEQQFRLHKLLAFDPSNECKGIFSDWFRFPSCCVCKCYDLPEELLMPRKSSRKLDTDDLHEENTENYQDDDEDMEYDNLSSFNELNPEEQEEEEQAEVDEVDDAEEDEKLHNNDSDYNDDIPVNYYRRISMQKRPQTYRVRSGGRMVNIPPQRRPRLPPRPSSHITSPRATSQPQPNSFSQQQESTTLGTLDVATPHYYYNISHYSHLFTNFHPFPLSRMPRSNPEG